jgi:hypothetical protein
LGFCADAKNDDEKAILMRISMIMLGRLRIHADVDATLGLDVRKLLQHAARCTDRGQLVCLWSEMLELLQEYQEDFAGG